MNRTRIHNDNTKIFSWQATALQARVSPQRVSVGAIAFDDKDPTI